jgi:hypothetical protein
MRFLLPAALAVALLTGSAEAYQSMGLGQSLAERGLLLGYRRADGKRPSGLADWVLGFLTGVGFASSSGMDPLNGLDGGAPVLAWMDNYCQVHPLERIHDAAIAFTKAHPH